MSEPGRVTRWMTSRKNTAGMLGALAGPVLATTGTVGWSWPAVSIGAYAVLALVVPDRPGPEPTLVATLRTESAELRAGLDDRSLPPDVGPAVRRILDVLAPVLDRLEQGSDRPGDAVALPGRLADVSAMIRDDIPGCLELYRARPPSTPDAYAAGELVRQLDLIGGAADRLSAEVADPGALRAEDLTALLRRRYPPPGPETP